MDRGHIIWEITWNCDKWLCSQVIIWCVDWISGAAPVYGLNLNWFWKAYFLQIPFCSYSDSFVVVVVDFIGCTYRTMLNDTDDSEHFILMLLNHWGDFYLHPYLCSSVLHIHQPVWPVIDHIGSAFANTLLTFPVFSPKQLEVLLLLSWPNFSLEVSDC